ncbi:MAG: hypothetical protein MJ054_02430, partial [Clostridia bacterium]|nr:hypothetical protein [Clostridia bacterium]
YLGGFTWGALGYDGVDVAKYQYQGVEYQTEKANWLVWRTLDFVSFRGVQLTSEQIKDVSPLVNRTYASIFLDTSLYDKNGFKDLAKSYAYRLKTA